jgi:prepilin-type N-terminal cleavage/methylation domain-containing protein
MRLRRQTTCYWHGQAKGLSLLELLVAIAMLSIVGAIAVPHLNKSILNLSTATQMLMGSIRVARADAVSRGTRYRVVFSADSYSVQRLQLSGDGEWVPAVTSEEVNLPSGITINVVEGDGVIEFNTRGLVVPPPGEEVAEIERLSLHDSRDGDTQYLEVWPSGQVLEG